MPGFSSLTETEITQVALYERVAFGGQDVMAAESDCGLVEAEGADEGETTASGG